MRSPQSLNAFSLKTAEKGENRLVNRGVWVDLTEIGSFACLLSIKHQRQRDLDEWRWVDGCSSLFVVFALARLLFFLKPEFFFGHRFVSGLTLAFVGVGLCLSSL